MLHRITALVLLVALPCLAGQPPGPVVPPDPGGDDTILKDLLDQWKTRKVYRNQDGVEGVGTVKPGEANLCQICMQPLYKHSDPGFECIPPGKRMLKIPSVPVQCPVCSVQFQGALPCNVNDRAGRDRDFCAHSVGKFTVHSNVWICPECGYAGLIPSDQKAAGFALGLDGKPVDQATKDFVKQKLFAPFRKRMLREAALKEENPPPELLQFGKYVTQNQIGDWVKYDHALQIYERVKPPHTLMAKLYLEAAHACRREVCDEISAPYLDETLLESLSKSISRINKYIQAECLDRRRSRGDPMIDPNKSETDPLLLTQAAAHIIKVGDEAVAQRKPVVAGTERAYFTNADMFVLRLTEAGALDRLGKADDAAKALAKALEYIPERPVVPLEDKTLEERIVRQLRLLRSIVEDRQTCLQREQQYLFKAATRDMAAIKFNEVTFRDCKRFDPKADEKLRHPAPASYLLGELLRRAGDPDGAAAWFAAANLIIEKGLDAVDAAEKIAPPAPVPVVLPGQEAPLSPFARERERLLVLKLWTKEQSALVKSTKQPDPNVKAIIEQMLQTVGIAPGTALTPREIHAEPVPQPAAKAAPAEKVLPAPKDAAAPAGDSAIKTREQLMKMYYAAIMRYRTDKKENPPSLADLVAAGYVKKEDCNLDDSGKLFCPETKERLGYMRRNWEPGDKTAPVIYPLKQGSKTLYADGEVRELFGKK